MNKHAVLAWSIIQSAAFLFSIVFCVVMGS